jgi:hypothetical protein
MIPCGDLLDRMPTIAAGQAAWSPEEAAHLAGCLECQADWALIQRARSLGQAAEALDADKLGSRVLARLAAARRADRIRRGGWLTGLAAAAVLALVLWRGGPAPERGTAPLPEAFSIPVAELETLDGGQLESVLDNLEGPLSAVGSPDLPSFGELDNQQLESVLGSMEG